MFNGLKGHKGDRASKAASRQSGSRTSTSSASSGQRPPSSQASDLAHSVPYNQLPSSKPVPVVASSPSAGLSYTLSGRREDGVPTARLISPSAALMEEMRPQSSASSHDSHTNGRHGTPSIRSEFGGGSPSPHPYNSNYGHSSATLATRRGSDTASLRTVASSSGSVSQRPNDELGRYPTLTRATQSYVPVSIPGRPAPQMPNYASSIASTSGRGHEEFAFPRPSDNEIERMFQVLVENRDLDQSSNVVPSISSRHSGFSTMSGVSSSAVARTTSTLSVDTKFQMVEADARSRWDTARRHKAKEEEAVKMGRGRRSAAAIPRDSPEYIIRKVLDDKLTQQHLTTLNVSLRTFPLE